MSVVFAARTRDGRWRVYVHHDRTVDLINERGTVILHRVPMAKVGQYLLAQGIDPDDLVPE